MRPYYEDEHVTLYHGDCREVLVGVLGLAGQAYDVCVTDPPYGETSLTWDRWPDAWPSAVAAVTESLWCFGSLRMFMEQRREFQAWTYAQEVVWEKHTGSGFTSDRFKRVHELVAHWYTGAWGEQRHETPRVESSAANKGRIVKMGHAPHRGTITPGNWTDDGTRLMRSVIPCRSMHGRAIHPTEKPLGILSPLIEYSCPIGGTVLDPFAGSGSTAVAAVMAGRRAVLIEAHEPYCELIARRLDQGVLDFGGVFNADRGLT